MARRARSNSPFRAIYALSAPPDCSGAAMLESCRGQPTPIFDFNGARSAIVDEVVARVCASVRDPLLVLNDAAYHETRRLGAVGRGRARRVARPRGGARPDERGRSSGRSSRSSHGRTPGTSRGTSTLASTSSRRKAVAPLIGVLLSPQTTLRNLGHSFDLTSLDGRIDVQGPREHVRKLAEIGTVIHVPTHLSNLDSVVFGFALERAGLPPATYGAGKNLFTNPVLSYFMHNLGAYRVDRRLKHGLYKDVLKTYSCVLIERGYHSLFFPGGTRSRSGGVERKLKLGLAGTGIEAFARSTVRGKTQPVFFVPSTINYLLTLEAETLIDDFLTEEGKARYIIEDDESAKVSRIAAFMNKLLGLDAGCVVRFSQPVDCFGNAVDEDGVSRDTARAGDRSRVVRARPGRPARARRRARGAVHARARRGHLRGVQARHRRDVDAPRRRGGVRPPAARRSGTPISSPSCGTRTTSRSRARASRPTSTSSSIARAGWRRRGSSSSRTA